LSDAPRLGDIEAGRRLERRRRVTDGSHVLLSPGDRL
jgi:hypothetical protein